MTNKLFIVKYILFDINFCEKINEKKSNEINTFLRNLSTNLNKHESFNNIIVFNVIIAQNICVFDIAKNVANKINKIKINKIIKSVKNKVNDEVNDDFKIICENVTNNTSSLNINFANVLNINFF